MKKKGFTLIELVMAVAIAGIAFYSLLIVFINAAYQSVDVEALSMGLYLANARLEEVSNQSYASITGEATAPFGSGFSDFSSVVRVDYVSSEALDLAVGTDFGYKKITIRVISSSLTSSIEVVTLATDASNE